MNLPDNLLTELPLSSIRVDAGAYQFRLGADGKTGVTRQYRYDDAEWNQEKHGNPLIVHQRLNGQYYVADGHHRLEFAKRSNGCGKGPKNLSAYLFREADGYTVKDVRLIAAYRNMERGHSNLLESAWVFHEARETPGVHQAWLPSLQMDKRNLRTAYVISGLSGRALSMVTENGINEKIAERAATQFANPAIQEGFLNIVGNDIRLKSYAGKITLERKQQSELQRN